MHPSHAASLEVTADLQLTNTSQRTRRKILPLTEAGLLINPEEDQEADPSPDIKEVTPGAEGTQEVLPIHVLLEGIVPAGSQDHDPEADPSPGLGLAGEDWGLIPIPINRNHNQGQDQDPKEDVVAVPEAMMIPDFQTTSIQNRTPSLHKRSVKFDQS